jgi:hypothetical protein
MTQNQTMKHTGGKISYTYNQEEKPEGATYICKYCNKQQFTHCWDLHKKSCTGTTNHQYRSK